MNGYRKLGVKTAHRQSMLRNLVTDLFRYGRIQTTDCRAKEARREAEKMITLAKKGDLHARRQALAYIKDEDVVSKLFDGAVDAIDDVPAKVAFLVECVRRGLPVVSSMGAGNKLDPAQVKTSDIAKSHGCPLARAVRKKLREAGVAKGVTVVFSPETIKTGAAFGTVSYMTAAFGVHCAAALLRQFGVCGRFVDFPSCNSV